MPTHESVALAFSAVEVPPLVDMSETNSPLPTVDSTATLYPNADTFISSNYPDNNYGTSTALLVGKPSSGGDQMARVSFSGIPSGATINSATLHLYRYTGEGAFTLSVQSASRSWSESTLTWNTDGSTARWTTPESKYVMTMPTGPLSVDVTSHVQEWADGTRTNYGFHLSVDDPWLVDPGNTRGFYSSEYSTASERPRLEIDYEIPFDGDLDLRDSGEVWLADAPQGNRVDYPVVGQQLYPHYSYLCEGTGTTPEFRREVSLDGYGVWCYNNSATATGGYTYTVWCTTPWTVTCGINTWRANVDVNDTVVDEWSEGNNYTWRTYDVSCPDLAGVDLYVADPADITTPLTEDPTEEDNVALVYKFTYAGPEPSEAATCRIQLDDESPWDWTGTLSSEGTWYLSHSPWIATAGNHRLRGWLDLYDDISLESDESNNYMDENPCFFVDSAENTRPVISLPLPDRELDEDGHLPEGIESVAYAGDAVHQYVGFDEDTFQYLGPGGDAVHQYVGFDEDTFQYLEPADDAVHEYVGFKGDTFEYLGTMDADPTGDSYMLYDHWGGTSSDAEKSPSNTDDDLLCWAAAASNVLEWTGWGLAGQMTDTDDMFAHFQDHWTDEGGWPEYAWDWWFDGTDNAPSGSHVDVPGGGGFYPLENFNDYFHKSWDESQALSTIDNYLHNGYGVTLLIYAPPDQGHAITVWGYNYNPSNPTDYYGLWVTDSDDYKHLTDPPDMLRYYEVQLSSGEWHLQDYYETNDWSIGGVQALDRKPVTDTFDLWEYASDAETPDDQLDFDISWMEDDECGAWIESNRYLRIDPHADWYGESDVTITVTDPAALSDEDTFTITVNPVNDEPSFTASNPPAVNENAEPQSLPGWATFDPGPPNELSQAVLQYAVTAVSNGELFSAGPSVAPDGTLTYTAAANANGTSTFKVAVQDSGGTANGGDDTSPTQTFTITVTPVNDRPVAVIDCPGFTYELRGADDDVEMFVELNGGFSFDPDPLGTIVSYEWDLDEDGIFGETGAEAQRGDEIGELFYSWPEDIDGPDDWLVQLRVVDNHGLTSDIAACTIEVWNARPDVEIEWWYGGEYEGQSLEVFGGISDMMDIVTWEIDWGDGAQDGGELYYPRYDTFGGTHVYEDDGTYYWQLFVEDDEGESNGRYYDVNVLNVPPWVWAGVDQQRIVVGQLVELYGSFEDYGILDTHTATIDWGDGTLEPGVVDQDAGGGTVSGSHAYGAPGEYVVTVTVTDDDHDTVGNGEGCDSFTVSVLPEIDVALIPLFEPSPSDSTTLPEGIDTVALGSTYYVEVWVQDAGSPGVGVAGGYVDLNYTTALADATAVVNQDFDVLPSGTIDDAAGLVDDLGGGTFGVGAGIAPEWVRLGYVELLCTGLGDVTFEVSEGAMQFSRVGAGNVLWSSVDLTDVATVSQIGTTRVDMTLVREPTGVDADTGEVDSLPGSEPWVHEWESFWVELWVSTPDTTTIPVLGGTIDLQYATAYATADLIEWGAAFTENRRRTIDDPSGLVDGVGAETTRTDVGDDRFALLARVKFVPTAGDNVPVDEVGHFIGPYDLGLGLDDDQIELADVGPVESILGPPAATEMWAVVYDIDDNDCIDFGDFSYFTPAFGEPVGGAEPPYIWWADFDKSGLVDFGDFSYFTPNFGHCKPDNGIVFPENFPEAWRAKLTARGGADRPSEAGVKEMPDTLVNVELVAVDGPTASDEVDTLPDSLSWVEMGSTYFVEIWVQDIGDAGAGISGGYVDLEYTTSGTDSVALHHGGLFTALPNGESDDAAGLIDNFGGGTFAGSVGVEPRWARLGYVEYIATDLGPMTFTLSEGSLAFALYQQGNVDWGDVDMGSLELTSLKTLYWDGIGNWDQPFWQDEADNADIPGAFANAVVRSGQVTATENPDAYNLTVESGTLLIAEDAILSLTGDFEISGDGTYAIKLDGPANGLLDVTGTASLAGTLDLQATGNLGDLTAEEWGDYTRTIISAAGGISGTFENVPDVVPVSEKSETSCVGHLGYGVFLTDKGPNLQPVTYNANSVVVDLFQAAPGDIDGDRDVDISDIMSILAAGKFGDGPVGAVWPEGNFDGDLDVDISDIMMVLATGLFGDGPYLGVKADGDVADDLVAALANLRMRNQLLRTVVDAKHVGSDAVPPSVFNPPSALNPGGTPSQPTPTPLNPGGTPSQPTPTPPLVWLDEIERRDAEGRKNGRLEQAVDLLWDAYATDR